MWIIGPLVTTALISLFYKIYLQLRIKNPEKKITFFSFFFRFYNPVDLFPLLRKPTNSNEAELRKKANISLAVFYLSFITIILIAAFHKNK